MSGFNYNIYSGTVSSAQSCAAAVTLPLFAMSSSTPMPVGPEQAVSYHVTTEFGAANLTQQLIIVVAEEDYADILDSDRAMADARVHGSRPWRQVRKSLGL
jgi:hypothetical protein